MMAELCTVIESTIFGNKVKDLEDDDPFSEFQEQFEKMLLQESALPQGNGMRTMWGDD